MVGRNIVVGGMTGGAGHTGLVTQGYGGTYTAPTPSGPPSLVGAWLTKPAPQKKYFSRQLLMLLKEYLELKLNEYR